MECIRYRKYIEEVLKGVEGYTPKVSRGIGGLLEIGEEIDVVKKIERKYGIEVGSSYLGKSIYIGEETEYIEKELGCKVNISKDVIKKCAEIVKRGYEIEKEAIEGVYRALLGESLKDG